jgi:hypothetical protein
MLRNLAKSLAEPSNSQGHRVVSNKVEGRQQQEPVVSKREVDKGRKKEEDKKVVGWQCEWVEEGERGGETELVFVGRKGREGRDVYRESRGSAMEVLELGWEEGDESGARTTAAGSVCCK